MIRRTLLSLALGSTLSTGTVFAQPEPPPEPKAPEPIEAELLPVAPRIAVRAVFVELQDNGYEIFLSRPAALRLQELLALTRDNEGNIAEMIRAQGKKSDDKELDLQLELLATLVRSQLPTFRKSLDTNMGDSGVSIRVTGIRRKRPERPLIKAIASAAMTEEVREKTRKLMAMAEFTPLLWKIEPRQ